MPTTAQLAALKTNVEADPVLSLLPATYASAQTIRDAYNALASPVASVWDAAAPVDRVADGIDDTKYTPADAANETLIGLQRIGQINIKQMNLQTRIMGRETIDARNPLVRASLRDSTITVPAGANGANVNPGGVNAANVLAKLFRETNATRAEKLWSTGPQTTGATTAEVLSFEGAITVDDVQLAMGW